MSRRNLTLVVVAVLAGCATSRVAPLDCEHWGAVAHHRPTAPTNPSTQKKEDAGDLARKAQNPIGAYWNIPFESNFNFGAGAHNDLQYVMNFQPVIPVKLTDDWTLINRAVMPVMSQPAMVAGDHREFGLGDTTLSLFLSPKSVPFILGVGPVLLLPTRTDKRLGDGRFGMGPAMVALTMQGPWVVGGLVQHIWDVGGSSRADVSQLLLQPIINYNLDDGWYLTSNTVYTADFEASSGEKWTAPLGGGFGKVHHFGNQPVNLRLQAFYNAHHPDNAGNWTLQFRFQLMF